MSKRAYRFPLLYNSLVSLKIPYARPHRHALVIHQPLRYPLIAFVPYLPHSLESSLCSDQYILTWSALGVLTWQFEDWEPAKILNMIERNQKIAIRNLSKECRRMDSVLGDTAMNQQNTIEQN
ncbi:hypothetical protein ACTXT7_003436 [Hymenolepis weldensis]